MNIVANWRLRRLAFSQLAVVLVLALALILAATAFAATQLSIAGYLDFGYPDTVREPTEGRPEHKLWYNDGKWWANMYSTQSNAYTIHQLDWNSQTWVNTNVVVDERPGARSDTLWDGTKLYIASYLKQENPGPVNTRRTSAGCIATHTPGVSTSWMPVSRSWGSPNIERRPCRWKKTPAAACGSPMLPVQPGPPQNTRYMCALQEPMIQIG
jgi:hypothetical protein